MKKIFLAALLAFFGFGLSAQVLYEDFETPSGITWQSLNGTFNGAIPNPHPDAENLSATVGSTTNNPASSSCYNVGDFASPIDVSEYNQFKIKIWSPIDTGQILFKLETIGGGTAAEDFQNITVANQWVEYTFDMSPAADVTTINRITIVFNFENFDSNTFFFDEIRAEIAFRVIEDFEGSSGITWTSLNGTYNGAVANPEPNQVNSSPTVGSFSNNPASSYNFAFGVLPVALDMTNFNRFSIQLYAPQATQLLFKLEGTPNSQNIEKIVNVAVANEWQEYTFDLSAAADITTITKILVVFSPGVDGSTATYYIDNITVVPDPCPDTAPDPDVLDDFDCNRNAIYSIGWDSLHVVENPDVDGDNPSEHVGQWNRPAGPGTQYAALVIDFQDSIILNVRNQFSVQVWAPKTGTMLLKIQGPNGNKEVPIPITEINTWVTYTADFSSRIGLADRELVIFFGSNADGAPGDIYYIDNIKLSTPTELPALEDFQDATLNLGWLPLDLQTVLHGNFTGPTANPNPGGVNNSTQVGCYSKGASSLSTLQILSVNAFDLSLFPQFNIDVLSPTAAVADQTQVTFQLISATTGSQEATAKIQTPGEWETLGFDFSTFSATTDFQEIRILFDPMTIAIGQSWCIDNLRQGLTNVDPCLDVEPNLNIIDNFECQRNYSIFYGADDIEAVNNPHINADNQSVKAGEYNDPPGGYEGIGYQFPTDFDLTTYNQLQVKIWSPTANVPFLFKLQGGTGQYEVRDTSEEANEWYTFRIDFSNPPANFTGDQLVIFLNEAFDAGGGTYYVDEIEWKREGYNGCFLDFETPATTITAFNYFDQGSYNQPFEVVPNPDPDPVNTSANVGKFVKPSDGGNFTGFYTDLDAPIDFQGIKEMRAKIYMDHLDTFVLKLEQDKSGLNLPNTEITYANTTINQWENTFHNFATAPDNARYQRFTIFFDWKGPGNGTSNVISYFDDIVIGAGACGIIGTWHPIPVEPMKISPNPTSSIVRVDNFRDIDRLEIFNAYGQRVMSVNTNLNAWVEVDVVALPPGVYMMSGYNPKGLLIGNAKFIKQ